MEHGWLMQNKGYENGTTKFSDARNIRTCINHFHPSFIQRYKNENYGLKTGASPALNLTQFTIQNDNHKEERSLSRIFDCTEDMQHVRDYENYKNSTNSIIFDCAKDTQQVWDYENNKNSTNVTAEVSIVTPTRDSQMIKRLCNLLEVEE